MLQISRKNLDEVRNCKTALNKLMTRIGKIKAVRICGVLSSSLQPVLQVLTSAQGPSQTSLHDPGSLSCLHQGTAKVLMISVSGCL